MTNAITVTTANSTTNTNAAKVPHFQMSSKLSVDSLMTNAESLRDAASAHYQQYEIGGRNAMLALMGDVYKFYFDLKHSEDNGEKVIAKIKAKLEDMKIEIRKSSPETTQLLRYICKDLDHKQVSIYGRSMKVAFKNGLTSSAEFIKFIENTEGGFSGVIDTDSPVAKNSVSTAADLALKDIKQEKTVYELEALDWVPNEEYRFLIAFRTDDETAILKNVLLPKKDQESVLKQHKAEKERRNKPSEDEAAVVAKLAIQAVESDLEGVDVELHNLETEHSNAAAEADTSRAAELRVSIMVAQMKKSGYEKIRNSLRNSVEKSASA